MSGVGTSSAAAAPKTNVAPLADRLQGGASDELLHCSHHIVRLVATCACLHGPACLGQSPAHAVCSAGASVGMNTTQAAEPAPVKPPGSTQFNLNTVSSRVTDLKTVRAGLKRCAMCVRASGDALCARVRLRLRLKSVFQTADLYKNVLMQCCAAEAAPMRGAVRVCRTACMLPRRSPGARTGTTSSA
jgi:hypothetical protein